MTATPPAITTRPAAATPPGAVTPPAELRELFFGFLSIGARSFGGVMPWAHRVLVEERRWISQEDFTSIVGLCQFLPGPNIGNASIVLGRRWFGVKGSVVAFLGFFGLPFIWVLALAVLYADFAGIPAVKRVVVGVAAAGAGLFIGTAIKLAKPIARKPAALVVVAGCFIAVGVGRVSMLIVIPVAAAISYYLSKRSLL
jgi:chromate transporter